MAVFIIIFILFFNIASGQALEDTTYREAEETITDLLQEPSEESDNSDLYETIEDLINNPIDINKAVLNELQRVPYIDITTANIILNYRKKFGRFFSVNELNSVGNLSKETVEKISPFLTVTDDMSSAKNSGNLISNYSVKLRSRIQNDLQKRKGFIDKKFTGSKYKIYNKIITNYKNIEVGFLTDKDPGENSINDFSSYFLSIKHLGFINNVVLGDYTVAWGQGLTLWRPYGFSKGADAVFPIKKNAKIVNRYASSTENNFLRGAAANFGFKNFLLIAFYSKNKFDANIDSFSNGILSTPIDGLHRTDNEITKRKSSEEIMYGSALNFSNNFINTGILYYKSVFSNPFIPGSMFDIQGDNFNYTSFYYDLYPDKINLFGELSFDGKSLASINGIQIPVNKNFIFVTSIRSYPRNFINLHGFSFGEKSGTGKNEFGIYNGVRWNSPIGTVNFYYDQFKFPYASYGIPLPSTGNEFLIDYKNKFVKNFDTRLRFKYENKETAFNENNLLILGRRIKKVSRLEIIYTISSQFKVKGRFEYNNISMNTGVFEEGFLAFQDLQYNPSQVIGLYSRIVFFKTGSYNSAVYEYENDLAGTLLNTALFGEGIRWYLLVRFNPYKIITISCKYSETFKPKEKSLGSGLMEIDGNLDNRFSFQLDLNY